MWNWFLELCHTRISAETVGPITWGEINEFESAQLLHIKVWEKNLIRELDIIARGVWLKTKPGDKEPNMVETSDAEGMKALFARLAAQKNG